MRVTVELVSGRHIRDLATMSIGNVTDLADVSSYAVEADEGHNPAAKTLPWDAVGVIGPHDRRQTVWALVALAAAWAADEAKRRRG